MFVAAVVQMNGSSDEARNFAQAEELIARAAAHGAKLVATPENTNFLGAAGEKVSRAQPLDGPVVARFAGLAKKLGIFYLLGSFNEKSEEQTRCYNTSVLLGPDGRIHGVYRKLHLFDVDLPGTTFFESQTCRPGDDVVVVDTPLGRVGLSICYDLRFPELYRKLVDAGAEILMIPSAFTHETGKDHWESLVRARAIETQCWVLAPGQHGRHDDGGLRRSWGHSMIVDPWGAVVAQAADGPNLALAEVDTSRVGSIRRQMPVARHRRF